MITSAPRRPVISNFTDLRAPALVNQSQSSIACAMTEAILEALGGLRVKNCRNQEFVPAKALDRLLDVPTVSSILDELVGTGSMQPYQRHEALEVILRDGKRVFATLCTMRKGSLIMEFIHHGDGFSGSRLDSMLPLDEATLKIIFPDKLSQEYRAFYDIQWSFLSPIFARNLWYRKLHGLSVLPFMAEQRMGSGSFGTVNRVFLHGLNQDLDRSTRETIRHISGLTIASHIHAN